MLTVAGCNAFNPAFVSVATGGGSGFGSLDNAPGHVVITFLNNAQVDERLISFLESTDGGSLNLTDAEKAELRPRIRLRVRVTFTDGTSQTVEFIGGSRSLIDQRFNAQVFPDLNQNDLDNVVTICDVASVTLEPGSAIEVFVPVEMTVFELVTSSGTGGEIVAEFEERQRIVPQFRVIQPDEVDTDGNVTLQRNVGVRDVLSPTNNPVCGSVIAISVDGVLSVPFLDVASGAPSYDVDDTITEATIGGRYEFRVSIQ